MAKRPKQKPAPYDDMPMKGQKPPADMPMKGKKKRALALLPLSAADVPASAVYKPGKDIASVRPVAGRSTIPSSAYLSGALAWLPRTRTVGSLEAMDLSRYRPDELVDMMVDANPDASMGTSNTILLVNSGVSLTVRNADDSKDDAKGLRLANELVDRLNYQAGGVDALIDSFAFCIYTRGAACAEAVPAPGLTELEDLYVVDPLTIRFSWLNLGTRDAPIWRQIMLQQTPWATQPKWLNPLQCFYLAYQARVDDPYGRAPILAGIGAILFWLEILRDLRRALHMNAWGRLDVSVLHDAMEKSAPEDVQDDPDRLNEWVEARLDEMKKELAGLEPDDSFVHWDAVTMSSVDAAGKMLDTQPMLRAVESLILRGIKQLPTLMGAAQTRGAGQLGTLEYQIATLAVKSMQRLIERILELTLELGLRLLGRKNRVHVTFEEVRTTDELKTQQALALKIQNYARMVQQNWISQTEAAQNVVSHEEVGPPPGLGQIGSDRPSPPPMPSNSNDPMNGTDPHSSQPGVGASTGEPGDQGAAPQPAPSRQFVPMQQIEDEILAIVGRAIEDGRLPELVGAE